MKSAISTDTIRNHLKHQVQIRISDSHEVQSETEYLEITNKLMISNDKIETMNILEIKEHIKVKTKKLIWLRCNLQFYDQTHSTGLYHISCLENCFNSWLSEYRYPDIWKLTKIVMFNKLKTRVSRCDQTRPISLLATHLKLLEK